MSELINALILSSVDHSTPGTALQLYRAAGSATAVIDCRMNIRDIAPGCPRRVADALANIDEARRRAEFEMEYASRHGIRILVNGSEGYPRRLDGCDDAPLVMFYRGTAELNRARVVSMVGTRRCTAYGQDCVRSFVRRLKELCPDTLIVSGLAYGIDISAHREALDNGMDTVAVLAHGLDNLYPPRHKDTAGRMLTQGGLLTEFFTRTNADKLNFLRRNRIVAGISDATVVVESASHGGGLVTARIAQSYNRDVFAFPGRVGDETDAQLVAARRQGIERTLFPELTDDEQRIVDTLENSNDQQLNPLSAALNMPVGTLAATMFSLEMKGVVKCLAGGVYHLIRS